MILIIRGSNLLLALAYYFLYPRQLVSKLLKKYMQEREKRAPTVMGSSLLLTLVFILKESRVDFPECPSARA